MKAQRESYSLKSVSADYGFEYFDWGPYLEKLLSVDKNYVDFIQYCKDDVIALRNIDKRTNLFDFYENLRKITGTRLDDVLYNLVPINDLARYGKVSCEYNPDTGKFNTKIKGRSTLDMLLAFKKYYIMKAQRESYSLKSAMLLLTWHR